MKNAAKKLTGAAKREFVAQITIDYFEGSSRKAESQMGWSRKTVAKGLKELETGVVCVDNYQARGRKKTEQKLTNLEEDIRSLIEDNSQTDATFQHYVIHVLVLKKSEKLLLVKKNI